MKAISRTAIIALSLIAILPGVSMAQKPAGRAAPVAPSKLVYPYKDLPGVVDPQQLSADEKFQCHTAIVYPRWWRGTFNRGLPRLGYVCEQNGTISWSTRPPNWSYWQYNGPGR